MAVVPERKGTRLHRFAIWVFSLLLTLLFIWLLGFIIRDINRIKGPNYPEIEAKYVDATLVTRKTALEDDLRQLEGEIANQRQVQEILRASTENSQRTMNQLLDLQRRNLEKDVSPSPEEQNALAESQAVFLRNQSEFQKANEQIAELTARQRNLQQELAQLERSIADQRRPAQEEFQRVNRRHSIMLASVKLIFLIPVFLLAVSVMMKKRKSPYAPIFYAFAFAAFWRTAEVIHQHFPSELFKYIAVIAAIAAVLFVLIRLIRMLSVPRKDWLIKQYREAYNNRVCPVCAFPIQRGDVSRVSKKQVSPITSPQDNTTAKLQDTPYTCPSCGQRLFEQCAQCGEIRHTLLPFCMHCGAESVLSS
mgnify:FL=1